MYSLKIKAPKGVLLLNGEVNGDTTLSDLQDKLYKLTSIPECKQKILTGFPPLLINGSENASLQSLGIKNGEVIIVEEDVSKSSSSITENKEVILDSNGSETNSLFSGKNRGKDSSAFPRGTLIKKVVPSDNSCLFGSIYYLLNGGKIATEELSNVREIVAEVVKKNKHIYNEALLEKSNEDYCKWILKDTSWGGAIELAVLSEYYEIEIVAIDAKCGIVNRFGEDKKYDNRIFLMYDGIHYDPLHLETYNGNILYVFPTTENWLLEQSYMIAREAKNSGQFTDTEKFKVKCNQCGFLMRGEIEAVNHAKQTKHSAFAEVKQ